MNKKYILLLLPLLLLGCQKNNDDISQKEDNYIRLESSKETYYSFSNDLCEVEGIAELLAETIDDIAVI